MWEEIRKHQEESIEKVSNKITNLLEGLRVDSETI